MSNWKTNKKNVGTVTVGQRQIIKFYANKELPKIVNLSSSCGCSKPNYDKKTKVLNVSYNPGSIPKHLKSQGWYNTTKTITITFVDGTKDVLSFSARVNKK